MIYLRISSYVAAFLRATGDGQSLSVSSPISFSPYTQEYVVLTNGLRVIPEAQQHRASCYSQSAWNNMLRGRLPQGGPAIIHRTPTDWLSYAEVCTLEALPNTTKTSAYEFIAIATPRDIYNGSRMVRVNNSYALESTAAYDLRRLLRNTFIRTYLEFETRNRLFATSQNFRRSGIEILERFFAEYNIPVSHDLRERESLRRLIQRWRKEAEYLVTQPAIINNPTITRIDPHERRGGLPSYSD